MKLIIQIPCFNEQENLAAVLQELPREIQGIDSIQVIVLDDGSTDRTAAVARENGADLVLSSSVNTGLARNFARGIEQALGLGADIIVNTDGDNQYKGTDIPRLIAPVLAGEADIVIGNRDPGDLNHFSARKRFLQRLGNRILTSISGVEIPDGVSGFRAYSRKTAMRMIIQSGFSYTLESLLQAALNGQRIKFIDIEVNPTERPSRLASSIGRFVLKQGLTILRTQTVNRPFRTFCALGIAMGIPGLLLGLRFVYHFLQGNGDGYVQSLILTAILLVCSFLSFLQAIAMDIVASNRRIMEEQLYLARCQYYDSGAAAGLKPEQKETAEPRKA